MVSDDLGAPMPAHEEIELLLDFLQHQRLDAAREKRAQSQLNDALLEGGWSFEREYRLSERDIVDFMVVVGDCRIALELKARSQRKRIFRQLERYAQHENVNALVLLTGTAMSLPETIKGKPAYLSSLGAGWL